MTDEVQEALTRHSLRYIEALEEGLESKSQAARLVARAIIAAKEFFKDQYGEPYAAIITDRAKEVYAMRSRGFRRWLRKLAWDAEGKPVAQETLKTVEGVLEGLAVFEGRRIELHNRVAWHDGAVWYDLTDKNWRAVKITAEGWEVVEDPPILFRRYAHQAPQVEPRRGGDLNRLLDYLNVNGDYKTLILPYLVTCLVPDIPHPLPVLHGPQGSTKTTFFRVLKRLADPSAVETLTFPRDINELVQKLAHHWLACFDNVTALPQWVSDALCRAVTGEGFSKRELYTDDEDVIYSFRRCVGLNGINVAATKPDLLDRAILIELERPSPEKRRKEADFWRDFEEARPYILGAVFDTLAAAMKIKQGLDLKELPRMADFAEWGEAVARALGYAPGVFLNAYYRNIGAQNLEALEAHVIGPAILALMEKTPEWEGTPTELLAALEELAEDMKINTNAKGWPKAANALSRKLKEIKTNLEAEGIAVVFDRAPRVSRKRLIRIWKKPSKPSKPSKPGPESMDDKSQQKIPSNISSKDSPGPMDDKSQQKIPSNISSKDSPGPMDDMDDMDDKIHTQKGAVEVVEDKPSQQERVKELLDALKDLDDGKGAAEKEIRRRLLQGSGWSDEALDHYLNLLKRTGVIYEPRPGRWKVA
jgi:hypothetical protein